MPSSPVRWFLLGVVVSCGEPQRETAAGSTSARTPAAPRLSCAEADSLEAGALWYSDAIYGMRGIAEGGTRVAVYPEPAAWRLVLEPIGSDVPDADTATGWPYGADPETLWIVWRDAVAGKGVVFPRDTVSSGGWLRERVDSIAFTIRCDTLVLAPWGARRRGAPLLLNRRMGPAF